MRSAKLKAADLFAGGGGTSTGLARACAHSGRKLDLVAVNHWDLAIETHKKNHPDARHYCTSLDGLNPRDVVPGGRLNILVASPECTHHAAARGGRPMNDQSRASAWLILKWLQELYVESILIENVPEFENWGPLGANGRPLKSRRGILFGQFIESLKALGYKVDWRVLNAANYGDPTSRNRLFIIGRRGNKQLSWPEPTHLPAHKTQTLFGNKKPWRAAREIIDWSVQGQSIFTRKRPLAINTLKRILAGMEKFKWPEPFIVVLRNHMAARSVDEPLPALTAGGTHIGLCEPFMLGQQSGASPRSTDQPVPTVAASGAISLIEAKPFIVPNFGERNGQHPRTHAIEDPLPAVTSHGAGALVEPFITTAGGPYGQGRNPQSLDKPLMTVLTENHMGLVEPFVMTANHGEPQPMIVKFDHQGTNGGRARSVDQPLPTITTKNGLAIVDAKPFIDKFYGTGVAADPDEPLDTVTAKARFGLCQVGDTLYDIRFRMLRPRELGRAMGFPDDYQFVGGSAAATKMIGNAVALGVAEALCAELIA